jgi:hypothetical protein
MNNLSKTQHAEVRMQQRGIPESVVDTLIQYGSVIHDHHGGQVVFFDKKAQRRCIAASGERILKHLERYRDVYLVKSADGALVTVGHRNKRLRRQ